MASSQTSSETGDEHAHHREQTPSAAEVSTDTARPPVLREPRTATVWKMECELRRAKAAQLKWIYQFHNDYVTEALEPFIADYESAKAREAAEVQLRHLRRVIHYASQEAQRAAIMFIAEAVNRSEFVVTSEYCAVQRAKESLPRTWKAFVEGRICDFRLRRITTLSEQLRTKEAIATLDEKAPETAESSRIGELNNWLKDFVHTVEPAEASERFARAAQQRRVTVTDIEDGMSVLTAVIPTLSAKAIQRRLEALTRSPVHPVPHNPLIAEHTFELQQEEVSHRLLPQQPAEYGVLLTRPNPGTAPSLHVTDGTHLAEELTAHQPGNQAQDEVDLADHHLAELPTPGAGHAVNAPAARGFTAKELPTSREAGDPRSLDQRSADVFCAWMLNAETPEGIEVDAQIGIIVSEDTLTGDSTRPATTRDGSTCIPARNIRDMLAHQVGRLEWYQLLHSKDDDLLAIRSSGRYPPPRLRTALWFRDRTCTAHGCTTPAERCDADHITPYETGGPTTAKNLQLLCRKHHRLKSWGYSVHRSRPELLFSHHARPDFTYSPAGLRLAA